VLFNSILFFFIKKFLFAEISIRPYSTLIGTSICKIFLMTFWNIKLVSIHREKEPKDELVDDVLQILNVYTAKMNGLRKYKGNM